MRGIHLPAPRCFSLIGQNREEAGPQCVGHTIVSYVGGGEAKRSNKGYGVCGTRFGLFFGQMKEIEIIKPLSRYSCVN